MDVFEMLGDPIRRRILELLTDGERSVWEFSAVVQKEFGVSQHRRTPPVGTATSTGPAPPSR
jgi:DNA-binding transcriptional ArsR family regulator